MFNNFLPRHYVVVNVRLVLFLSTIIERESRWFVYRKVQKINCQNSRITFNPTLFLIFDNLVLFTFLNVIEAFNVSN